MGDGGQLRICDIPEPDRPTQWVALVVEDDDDQRDLIGAILEESDVKVIACDSAEAAMQVMEKVGDRAVFVLTDVELAGTMDGVDLARELGDRWPHTRVVTTSGGCDKQAARQIAETYPASGKALARARPHHRAGTGDRRPLIGIPSIRLLKCQVCFLSDFSEALAARMVLRLRQGGDRSRKPLTHDLIVQGIFRRRREQPIFQGADRRLFGFAGAKAFRCRRVGRSHGCLPDWPLNGRIRLSVPPRQAPNLAFVIGRRNRLDRRDAAPPAPLLLRPLGA